MEIKIIECEDIQTLKICSNLRKKVFFEEESAPEMLYIIDDMDLLETTQNFIAYYNGEPIATVRYIKIDDRTIKIQRMLCLSKYRRKGIAKKLLKYLEDHAYNNNYKKIIMDSAEQAVEFYKNSGYIEKSGVFFEDGRPHVKMEKILY